MMDAVDEYAGRPHPDRRGVPRALRQSVRGDPPRRRAPVAARRRAAHRAHRGRDLDARRSASSRTATASPSFDANGGRHRGIALIGCDGVKSAVRRAVRRRRRRASRATSSIARSSTTTDFPADLRWNAASIWVGPNCHLVHYPLRGGEQYNVVVTFHSREQEEWGVREGSREEVLCYFEGICAKRAPADRPAQETGSAGPPPTASRSRSGRSAASRCWATRRTRCCNTSRRAPAWRWRTR